MRLIQGAMHKEGKEVKSELAGMTASCTGGIVRTFNTNECQVVIPGNGDRIFAATYDNEMLFTILRCEGRRHNCWDEGAAICKISYSRSSIDAASFSWTLIN